MTKSWIKTILATIVAVGLVVMAGSQLTDPGPMNGSGWNIYTVVFTGPGDQQYSLALDSNDNPHVSYFEVGYNILKYAKWDGSSWNIETVDSGYLGAPIGEYSSIALDSNDNPHISYYAGSPDNDLKYAKWDGSGWNIETVDSADDVGWCTSLALDGSDNPRISYYDYTNHDLKYAKWDGSGWNIEMVDSDGGVGWCTSLALDSSDNPHISYMDDTNYDLKYAKWDGSSWNIETVDSDGFAGWYSSIALDSSDNPHISYYDHTNYYDLNYAKWDGSSWNIEAVDSAGEVGEYTSMALDSNDNPHISYYDRTNQDLKYAKWDGSSWNIETVDSAGDVGYWTSLALDSDDNPHISYADRSNDDLKYATKAELGAVTDPGETAEELGEYIADIDPGAFFNPNLQNAMGNKINAVLNQIEDDDICGAINKLKHDVLPKVDGEFPPPDWVTDPVEQQALEDMVLDLIAELEELAEDLNLDCG